MSVQSMACPKCGKQATEYEEGKWHCLNHRCQIKFVYEEPESPTINIDNRTSMSVNSDSLYDLDVSTKRFHALRDVYHDIIKPIYSRSYTPVSSVILGLMWLLSSFGCWVYVVWSWNNYAVWTDNMIALNTLLVIFSPLPIIFFCMCITKKETNLLRKVKQQQLKHVDMIGTCPNCGIEYLVARRYAVSGFMEVVTQTGLVHCGECGRQMLVTSEYTVLLKK